MKTEIYEGAKIAPYVKTVAELRVGIYREYPYLYDGNVEFELKETLPIYTRSKNSVWGVARDGEKIIGLAIWLPLSEISRDLQTPLLEKELDVEAYCCLVDLMVLKEYQGQGIGKRLYAISEEHVKKEQRYSYLTLYTIERPIKDHKKPKDYTSLDEYWKKRGFVKHPELFFTHPWKDIGDKVDTDHTLIFWIKDLNGFSFRPVNRSYLKLILQWLDQEHITAWLHGEGKKRTIEDLKKSFEGENEFDHWLSFDGGKPFAYLLTSQILKGKGDDLEKWCSKKGQAITLDVLISDPDYLGKGIGPRMIQEFLLSQFPEVVEVLIDPETSNKRAIRAYEKAGFQILGEFVPSYHPVTHTMMRLDLEKLRLGN